MTTPFNLSPFNMTWSPEYHLPLSGAVNQDIHTQWFDKIDQEHGKGNGQLEKKIFLEIGSYGRQLGLILDVLVPVVTVLLEDETNREKVLRVLENNHQSKEETQESWETLQEAHKMIAAVKQSYYHEHEAFLHKEMEKLKKQDPEAFDRLISKVTS